MLLKGFIVLPLMAAACASLERSAAAQPFPSDSGVVDVRAFGARGDGVHDDTAAIQAAIDASLVVPKYFWPTRIVYLPAGRYLVRDTLQRRDREGRYQAQLALIGDGPGATTIALPDACPGFGDRARPKAVVFTSSGLRGGAPDAGGKQYLELGEGNDAYANYVEALAIDVGASNPGAIAIDYLSNNIGAIRNVALRAAAGSGAVAIAMERRWPGPSLVTDLVVEGFRVGVSVRHPEYGVTLQRARFSRQEEVAIRNAGNSISMRDVVIEAAGLGVSNDDPRGLIVAEGVRFVPLAQGAVFARNTGYLTLRRPRRAADRRALGPFAQGGAWSGTSVQSAFGSDWCLPDPPPSAANALPPASEWANAVKFGAKPDSPKDAATAIQAALDSGARVVYLPTGTYTIDRPLVIPEGVTHIAGMMSTLTVGRREVFPREEGMLRIASGGSPLTIQHLALDNMARGSQIGVEHTGARSLRLQDFIGGGASVGRAPSGGPLVLENTVGPLHVRGASGVWASQLNVEGQGVLIRNHGAPLSILGLKTEQNATIVETKDAGQTEILGGLVYLVFPPAEVRPVLTNYGSGRVFAAYSESAYRPGAVYLEHMVQIDPRIRRVVVSAEDLPARGRGLGRLVPGRTFGGRHCVAAGKGVP